MAKMLGELLVEHKLITTRQLDHALDAQKVYGGKLGTNLVELGLIRDIDLVKFLSKQLRMEAASQNDFENIPKEVLQLVSKEFAGEHKVIPLSMDRKLKVAISDPHSLEPIDKLRFQLSKSVQPVIAPEIWIVAALERHYQIPRSIRFLPMESKDEDFSLQIVHDLATEVRYKEESDQAQTVQLTTPEPKPAEISYNILATSFKSFSDRLVGAITKEEIFTAIMDLLSSIFSRMAIYIVRKTEIQGWVLRGFAVYDREFRSVRIPYSQKTIFKSVLTSNKSFKGAISMNKEDPERFTVLNISLGTEIELHPISIREKPVALLLGTLDPGKKITEEKASKLIVSALKKAGYALEILALRKAIETPI